MAVFFLDFWGPFFGPNRAETRARVDAAAGSIFATFSPLGQSDLEPARGPLKRTGLRGFIFKKWQIFILGHFGVPFVAKKKLLLPRF